MKITIEINNNEDVTEAIQTLQKLLVTEQAPKVTTAKKTTKKVEPEKVVKKVEPEKQETSPELKPSAVFELAKELAKKHGSARVKEVIKKYGEKMADIKSEDLVAFNKDLSSLS